MAPAPVEPIRSHVSAAGAVDEPSQRIEAVAPTRRATVVVLAADVADALPQLIVDRRIVAPARGNGMLGIGSTMTCAAPHRPTVVDSIHDDLPDALGWDAVILAEASEAHVTAGVPLEQTDNELYTLRVDLQKMRRIRLASEPDRRVACRIREAAEARLIPRQSKPIIDEIDEMLGEFYGLPAAEADFIRNYEIKYRLGPDSHDEAA